MKTKKRPGKPGTNMQLGYGWLPDPPDKRDLFFADLKKPGAFALPTSIDFTSQMSKVEHQGYTNACTGHAVANVLEFIRRGCGPIFDHVDISRLFLYYNARWLEGGSKWDTGAYLRDVIKAAAQWGAAHEKHWPYVISKLTSRPTNYAYEQAVGFTIKDYSRLTTVEEMKQCLASGFPFVFGFTCYTAFAGATVARTGVLNMPGSTERPTGAHAVTAVGYDDKTKRFRIKNSWGEKWGQKGYFTIPYDYLADRNLSDDFWCVRS